MSTIVIPEKLKGKLPEGSFVYALLKNISLQLWATDYFPEYTLHDESHINAVLEYAASLIPQTIIEKLSIRAVEILVGAIALHDLGMFIKRDGLRRLIFGEHKDHLIKFLDKNSWVQEWRIFYGKARRYSDRQLLSLFGDTVPIEKLPEDVPAEDTKRQRLLYGEFIRTHHARLALDIALLGLPGSGNNIDVFKDCGCNTNTKTLIGLVARGHGMRSLREADEYINNLPTPPRDVPIYYLMAILQIADSLDIGPERAPVERELADELNSPESKRQFRLNQAISAKPHFEFKKRSVCIDGEPDCSGTFTGLESVLKKIQRELDNSWAILAEKYHGEYAFSIHRVESNMFDEKRVAAITSGYLARGAQLGANPDIVKLLVEPLYGNDPTYGVRELLQNSVDACRERKEIDGTAGKISIHIDIKRRKFIIQDNGTGMNEDVLCNYYLVAGASYRYSDTWREKHLVDNKKMNVMRNGRFGIGALAAFLLGDEVTVTTRHYSEKSGYTFRYSKEPCTLNVQRIPTDADGEGLDIGTTITITMKDSVCEYFAKCGNSPYRFDDKSWNNWYHFSEPQIQYYLDGREIERLQAFIPGVGIERDRWYDFSSSVFPEMKLNFHSSSRNIACIMNGISIIDDRSESYQLPIGGSGFLVPPPCIAVNNYSNDDKLGVNLSRTQIVGFPKREEDLIIEETYKYYLARFLSAPWEKSDAFLSTSLFDRRFIVSAEGFSVCHPTFMQHANVRNVLFLVRPITRGVSAKEPQTHIGSVDRPVAVLFGDIPNNCKFEDVEVVKRGSIRQNCINCWYEGSHEQYKNWSPRFFGNNSYAYHDLGSTRCHISKKGEMRLQPPYNLLSKEIPLIIEYRPTRFILRLNNPMKKVLCEFLPQDINGGWIPFKLDERKRMYKKTFEKLERYMHEETTEK